MKGYYSEGLAAERLRHVYDLASPRVRQYLGAEMKCVAAKICERDSVLDLGCGYGRTLPDLCRRASFVYGIDSSLASLRMAQQTMKVHHNCHLVCMDAVNLAFSDDQFDAVICIQNGISAFHVDPLALLEESMRVTKPGGRLLFSSYSPRFWPDRLQWFERQAEAGLVGPIDYDRTADGVIVCTDGFRATTVSSEQFLDWAKLLGVRAQVAEVDESSVFCEFYAS